MAKLILDDVANIKDVSAASTINGNSARIETALENTLSRNGTSPNAMEASLDMNSNKIINLPRATTTTEPIRYGDIDSVIAELDGFARFASDAEALAGTATNLLMSPAATKYVVDTFEGTLGTAAYKNIGTFGNVVPVLDDNNTWSRQQTINGSLFVTAAVTDSLPTSVGGFDWLSSGSTARLYSVGPDVSTNGQIQLISYNSNTSNAKIGLTVLGTGGLRFDSYAGSAMLALDSNKNITPRAITGTAAEITVANGNGATGNPTLSLPTALTFTGKTVTGGTFNATALNGPVAATTLSASGLITATGGQIKFPAIQIPSADANTLDDYEEGMWTPELKFGAGTNNNVAYSSQIGYYIKVGRLVCVWCRIIMNGKGTDTGAATVGGIPFASSSSYPAGATMGYYANFTGLTGALMASLNAAMTDRFSLLQSSATGTAAITDTVFNATTRFDFATSYVATA